MENNRPLMVGDWVKGKSVTGELVIGYVEKVQLLLETVKLTVTESDNVHIVGRTIETFRSMLTMMPLEDIRDENDIRTVIDIALSTKDEKWFLQLSELLQQKKESRGNRTISRNRLGSPKVS